MPDLNGRNLVQQCAEAILHLEPDPIPKHLILRDVLHRSPEDPELVEVKQQSLRSKWVAALAAEQQPNGGWSRFHSMNSKARHKIPTTEFGVSRALTLGLTKDDTVLHKAQSYLEGLLAGTIAWPEDEGKEPNDRWATGEEMFVSATLALLTPDHPILVPVMRKWCWIAEATFASGSYDPEAEWHAHCQLTGATSMRNSYLVLDNRYALTILGSAGDMLNPQTEKKLLDWLWTRPRGVGYLQVPLNSVLTHLSPRSLGRWFESQDILQRFPSWHRKIDPRVDVSG